MEHKLHRPSAREDWVARYRLLDELDRALQQRVVLVCAPAGYGKTTMLAQFVDRNETASVAWVTMDRGDNDPGRLWSHVAAALEVSGSVVDDGTTWLFPVNGAAVMGHVLPRLLRRLAAVRGEVVIVLDDFHLVDQPVCHDQLEFFISHLPEHAHLVISARSEPPLRLGRLRASGGLGEVRAQHLGFTAEEAAALLTRKHLHLDDESVDRLVDDTEGWPAGIYLAALAMEGRQRPDDVVSELAERHRFVEDYLTEEVLSGQSEDVRRFILDVSVLDRFTPDLCDAVTERSHSSRILRDLERTNLFLVPLVNPGSRRTWFRFHHLFAAVARTELEAAHPERISALHARAAAWFKERGHVDEAFRHFLLAGDTDGAALVAETHWLTYVNAGRQATVRSWLEALGPAHAGSDPARVVLAAWMAALGGDGAALAQHVRSLEPALQHGPLPDGSRSVESAIAIISGVWGYGGRTEVVRSGRRAAELEDDSRSPFHAFAALAAGHGAYLAGDLDAAARWLATATKQPTVPVLIAVVSGSLASIVEGERGHARRSRSMAEQAMRLVEDHGLGVLPQSSLAYAALGRVQAADGDVVTALATLEHGLALRRLNRALGPWTTIHHLVVAAPVAAQAGADVLARALVKQLVELVDQYDPEPGGPVRERLAQVQLAVNPERRAAVSGEPLSSREMDVLRLLRSSLSLPSIARALHLSTNTVKTHSRSIYQKLDAHSREEAVAIARRSGLL